MGVTRSTLRDDVLAYARDVVRIAQADTAIHMRSDPRAPRDTGRTASLTSSKATVRTQGTRAVGGVQNPSTIASYQDKGTPAHPIVPRRRGGVLVFHWPKAGGVVFLRRVHHPGSTKHVGWFEASAERYWMPALRRAVSALGTR